MSTQPIVVTMPFREVHIAGMIIYTNGVGELFVKTDAMYPPIRMIGGLNGDIHVAVTTVLPIVYCTDDKLLGVTLHNDD
jgi:hypothetical protein